jgi:uncharacterized protein
MNAIRKLFPGSSAALLGLGIAALGFSSIQALAQRVEALPTPTDYVSDNAHVLSPMAIARIDRICKQLDTEAKAQIAVVTVKSLDGDDSADYATRVFERFKIGAKGTDRGLLILLAVDDRKWSFKTGYGLEGILPDGKTGDMGRAMVPYLRNRDYDGAILSGVTAAAQVIAEDAKITLTDAAPTPHAAVNYQSHDASIGKTIKLIFILIFVFIFIVSRIIRFFFGGWWGGGPWIGGGYGGGMGGGGSWGGGGGGDSGGGFGGFGGGSTGGGGSDGSW